MRCSRDSFKRICSQVANSCAIASFLVTVKAALTNLVSRSWMLLATGYRFTLLRVSWRGTVAAVEVEGAGVELAPIGAGWGRRQG